jgi:hypothetical protein
MVCDYGEKWLPADDGFVVFLAAILDGFSAY